MQFLFSALALQGVFGDRRRLPADSSPSGAMVGMVCAGSSPSALFLFFVLYRAKNNKKYTSFLGLFPPLNAKNRAPDRLGEPIGSPILLVFIGFVNSAPEFLCNKQKETPFAVVDKRGFLSVCNAPNGAQR